MALLLWVASVLQGVLAPAIRIGSVAPDLPLLMLGCLALRLNPSAAATAGFFAGLLHASQIDQTVGSWIISRTVAAFTIAWLPAIVDRRRLLSVCLACALVVLIANGLIYLIAPSIVGWEWWQTTLGVMGYNILLAAPTAFALQRVLPPYQEEME